MSPGGQALALWLPLNPAPGTVLALQENQDDLCGREEEKRGYSEADTRKGSEKGIERPETQALLVPSSPF